MSRRHGPPADGWERSTEGDLDPDLTEEAGYGRWEPPRRRRGAILLKGALALVLLAMLAGVVLPLLVR